MKNILVLGAGLVSEPGIRYILNEGRFKLTVADQDPTKALQVIRGHQLGTAIGLDVNNSDELEKLVKNSDIVVSLLPWTLHPIIARLCLASNKHLVTASYVSD